MTNLIHTFTHDGYTVSIYQDEEPESPREWANLGIIVVSPGFARHWTDRAHGGIYDEVLDIGVAEVPCPAGHDPESGDPIDDCGICGGWGSVGLVGCDALGGTPRERVESHLRDRYGATVVLPLGMIDHSGISFYVGAGAHAMDPGGWDSGQVGWIMDTPAGREECGTPPELIEEVLRDEVAAPDQRARGDVYGYVIRDVNGDEVESCSGIYGYDDAVEEAKAASPSPADMPERTYPVRLSADQLRTLGMEVPK